MVSKNALLKRINRRLASDYEAVKVTRGERLRREVGDHHRFDCGLGAVVEYDVNLEATARALGVLHEGETVAG